MAAYIGWVDGAVSLQPQKRGEAGIVVGGQVQEFCQSWAKKSSDGDGTIYFIAQLPADAIIVSLLLYNDALTGCTSADVGLYGMDSAVAASAAKANAGAGTGSNPSQSKVDAGAIFLTATDISSGNAQGSEKNVLTNIVVQTVTTLGATTNGFLNYGLKLWQLLGFSDPKYADAFYALGMRLNTAGSAAGNLVLRGRFIQG